MPITTDAAGLAVIFKVKADFLKALAHSSRLSIIEYLKSREAPVGQMVKDLGMEQSGLSKHLAILRQAGILSSRHEGSNVFYAIKDRDIFNVLRPINQILKKKLVESGDLLNRLASS